MTEYDLIVIGAGIAGENVADRARAGGLSVVIVERELVGGDCSYWACMPSKALLRSAAALRAARAVGGAREAVAGELDVAAVFARRDATVHDWNDSGQVDWLDSVGIDLVRGDARVTGEREVTVAVPDGGPIVLTARHAVAVCTGSAAMLPDIPGLREAAPWASRDATSATQAPARLAIIGGGVVAVEMATAYAGFGTQVTVLSRSGLLGHEEPFAGELVQEGLRGLGATVRTGVSPASVHRNGQEVVVELDDGSSVTTEELLVATGRVPRTMGLGLEAFDLSAPGEGGGHGGGWRDGDWIDVDDTLRVHGVDWLYAVGDVNHRALLTHQGKYQARAAGDVIAARANGEEVDDAPWGRHVATADHRSVPQVTFCEPEVASVGLTEKAAREAGLDIRVVDYDLGNLGGASLHADGYTGRTRMVVDESRQVIVGMTFVGPDVAELVQAATNAVVGEVPLDRLWHAVPAYPTVSEVWLRLLEAYRG
ncbi:NAD(P)/FAD-dependent oxidoreductase [Leifsonia bigeumensis]|uniref:NAD(P)/FAD-dependent oxidoreductase n=1 Tax=Leifsonella bigeumensis TaxID=433643 RepID=A0ABP7FI44_9MICO